MYKGCMNGKSCLLIDILNKHFFWLFSGQGLYTHQKCNSSRNAVCAVPSGYYCVNYTEDKECTFAAPHSVCSPGQGIKTPGDYVRNCLVTHLDGLLLNYI